MLAAISKLYRNYKRSRLTATVAETALNITATARLLADEVETRHATKPDQSAALFVVLGETHHQAAQLLMQMQLLRLLRQRGYRLAVGLETPYNLSAGILHYLGAKARDYPPLAELTEQAQKFDHGHRGHLFLASQFSIADHASLTKKLQKQVFLRDRLVVAFNDAAMMDYGQSDHLDMKDPVTRRVIAANATLFDGAQSYNALTRAGIHLRNRVMHHQAVSHAASVKPDIYVQLCGNSHVLGLRDRTATRPYTESLTAIFEQSGQAVLGVPVFERDFKPDDLPGPSRSAAFLQIYLSAATFSRKESDLEKHWLQEIIPHLDAAYYSKDLPGDLSGNPGGSGPRPTSP